MANKKEPIAWITVKGVRVPIFEGQSKEDAFKSFKERIGKRNSNQPTTQAEKKRVLKEYTNARNAAHNAKPDKQEKAGERFEKAKQKYSESKQKTGIKSATFTSPSDRDPANKTNDEFMRRENERYERERGKGTYQKEETQKQQRIEQARKASSNPHERVESLAKRMENAKTEQEREAVRNDMDKAWKDIDHNKKLDDREKNHLESRLRDIYDKSKAQANIKKNEDEKEKQIARNEAEKKQAEDNDKRLGSYKVSELRMSDDEYEKYVSDRLVKNGWKKETADREAKQSVIDRAEDKSYFIKTGQLSLQDAWGTNKSSGSGQYDKYKTGYKYENAKTVNVNGNEYKVWSDDTYRGTFAEDKNGKVLPIKQSGYLSKEVSQRKAIANTFGESSFRSKAGSTGNKTSGMSKEEAMLNYKAIKISKNMPKEKQEELKRLKAQYLKIWKG